MSTGQGKMRKYPEKKSPTDCLKPVGKDVKFIASIPPSRSWLCAASYEILRHVLPGEDLFLVDNNVPLAF